MMHGTMSLKKKMVYQSVHRLSS